jgi:seryl-tRNA synthetase
MDILIERLKIIKLELKEKEDKLKEVNEKIKDILLNLPNIPHYSVPIGKSSKENILVKVWDKDYIYINKQYLKSVCGN